MRVLFAWRQIRIDKKVKKKNKIGKIHDRRNSYVLIGRITWTIVWLVQMNIVVDCASHYHLQYLQCRYEFWYWPWHSEFHCFKCVVWVHDWVYDIVHVAEPPGRWLKFGNTVKAICKYSSMVIVVQKYKRLLSEYNEYCIN